MKEDIIDTTGLSESEVLAALYNASKPQGLGFLHFTPQPMSVDEAGEILKSGNYFDYLKGRVMKVEIENPISAGLYDRDNGQGAARRAIDAIRGKESGRMNIETKLAELDAQIADRTKTKVILAEDMHAKERVYKDALNTWAAVYEHIDDLEKKRELLIELQKECECVISRGVPVPDGQMVKDEDIGRTVPLPPQLIDNGDGTYRVPIFKDEREFIEPKL